jgi:hypothetical protein
MSELNGYKPQHPFDMFDHIVTGASFCTPAESAIQSMKAREIWLRGGMCYARVGNLIYVTYDMTGGIC